MPDKLGSHELLCGMHRRGGIGRQSNFKKIASRSVTEEPNIIWSQTNIPMLETRDGCEVSLYTRVIPLVGGHYSVIYSLMDGIYGGSGECISHGVVALDMASTVPLVSASAMELSLA